MCYVHIHTSTYPCSRNHICMQIYSIDTYTQWEVVLMKQNNKLNRFIMHTKHTGTSKCIWSFLLHCFSTFFWIYWLYCSKIVLSSHCFYWNALLAFARNDCTQGNVHTVYSIWPFFLKTCPSVVTQKVNLLNVNKKRERERPLTTIWKKGRYMRERGGPFPVNSTQFLFL